MDRLGWRDELEMLGPWRTFWTLWWTIPRNRDQLACLRWGHV